MKGSGYLDIFVDNQAKTPVYYVYSTLKPGILADTHPFSETLHATEIIDEDGRKVTEFVDMLGRTVRQQQWVSGNTYAITDYVYDSYGWLAYVLPPAIEKTNNKTITVSLPASYNATSEFARFVYAYKYDERGRVIEKHMQPIICQVNIFEFHQDKTNS